MNNAPKIPNLYIPESRKDLRYHKDYARAIISKTQFDGSFFERCRYNSAYYQSKSDVRSDHNLMLNTAAHIEYPLDMYQHNYVRGLIEFAVGDIVERNTEIHGVALSKQALNRKDQGLLRMKARYLLRDFTIQQQDITGIPLISPDDPSDDYQFAEKQKSYKEMGEIIYERCINDFWQRNKMDMRLALMTEDAHVEGITHCIPRIINNRVFLDSLRPGEVLFDDDATDLCLSDAGYYCIYRYMDLIDIQTLFNIPDEDMAKIEKSSGSFQLNALDGRQFRYNTSLIENGRKSYLVSEVYWIDAVQKKLTEEEGKNGFVHTKIRDMYHDKKPSKNEEIKAEFGLQMVRKCVIIGEDYVPEGHWGKVENQFRNHSNWTVTRIPVVSMAPRMRDKMITSTMDLLIPSDKFIDRCWFMIQKAMRKDRGKGMVSDTSQKPNEYTYLQQQYFFDVDGYMPINSGQIGGKGNYLSHQVLDMSISNTIQIYLGFIEAAKQSMREQAGITEPLMGANESVGTKTGVVQLQVRQASVRSFKYYKIFDTFLERLFENVINLYRICIKRDPEAYVHIIGSDGVKFMRDYPDFDMDDYGVFVKSVFRNQEVRDRVNSMLEYGLNSQSLPFDIALEVIRNEDNPQEALLLMREKLEQLRRKQEVEAKKAQAMEMQMQMENNQIQRELIQAELAKQQQNRDHDLTLANMERQRKIKELQQQGAITLSKARMDNATDLAVEKIRGENQKNQAAVRTN